jgi:hypothetical protein
MLFNNRLDNRSDNHPDARGEPRACELTTGFVPGDYPTKKTKIAPEPVSFINQEEWERYQHIKALPVIANPAMGLLKDRQHRERKSLPSKLRQNLPHPPLGAAPGPVRTCPRRILNIARHLQKLQHKQERRRLRYKPQGWRRRGISGKARFEDWLRD